MATARFRRFELVRHKDETGVSGSGRVAEGVQFSTGKCALSWVSPIHSITVYDNIEGLITVHGHDGATEIEWLDPE